MVLLIIYYFLDFHIKPLVRYTLLLQGTMKIETKNIYHYKHILCLFGQQQHYLYQNGSKVLRCISKDPGCVYSSRAGFWSLWYGQITPVSRGPWCRWSVSSHSVCSGRTSAGSTYTGKQKSHVNIICYLLLRSYPQKYAIFDHFPILKKLGIAPLLGGPEFNQPTKSMWGLLWSRTGSPYLSRTNKFTEVHVIFFFKDVDYFEGLYKIISLKKEYRFSSL